MKMVFQTPFLQCMKNFHIVAIDALTNLLPPSSTADYEKHITGMLHELKELSNSAGATIHVLVLSHPLDSQSNKANDVTAKRICANLTAKNISASLLQISGRQSQVKILPINLSCMNALIRINIS